MNYAEAYNNKSKGKNMQSIDPYYLFLYMRDACDADFFTKYNESKILPKNLGRVKKEFQDRFKKKNGDFLSLWTQQERNKFNKYLKSFFNNNGNSTLDTVLSNEVQAKNIINNINSLNSDFAKASDVMNAVELMADSLDKIVDRLNNNAPSRKGLFVDYLKYGQKNIKPEDFHLKNGELIKRAGKIDVDIFNKNTDDIIKTIKDVNERCRKIKAGYPMTINGEVDSIDKVMETAKTFINSFYKIRGIFNEWLVLKSIIDGNIESLEAISTGTFAEGGLGRKRKETFETGMNKTAVIIDNNLFRDIEKLKDIRKNMWTIASKKMGNPKADITIAHKGKNGYIYEEGLSLKSTTDTGQGQEVNLGGSGVNLGVMIRQIDNENFGEGKINQYYAMQMMTGVSEEGFIVGPSTDGYETTVAEKQIRFNKYVKKIALLHFVDYISGLGGFADFATYLVVNNDIYDIYKIIETVYTAYNLSGDVNFVNIVGYPQVESESILKLQHQAFKEPRIYKKKKETTAKKRLSVGQDYYTDRSVQDNVNTIYGIKRSEELWRKYNSILNQYLKVSLKMAALKQLRINK